MDKLHQIDITILKPAEYNPRQAGEQEYNNLKESITRFGLVDPIIVNSAPNRLNTIIGGHFRVKVAQDLGITQAPVVYVNIPEEERERELNLRLNKNLGEWDFNLLANFDENMLKDVGFTSEELDKIFQLDMEDNDPDSIPEVKEVGVKLGDLYQLGTHRLLCGDSTQKQAVERLMAGNKADMVFTDPPYGIDYQDLKKRFNKILGDESIDNIANLLFYTLLNNCPLFICCNWKSFSAFERVMTQTDKQPKSCIVWDKKVRIQNLDKFYKQHEFILYYGPFGGQKTVAGDVWRCDREVRSDHPTAKPVELIEKALEYASMRGQVVQDLFGGSGSTLIACERLNRKCYMMEIDPKYCQVIIDRWEAYANGKAKKVDR